ncbi:hypothetical protein SODG_001277 [Sodalis praecaptivus]
MSPFRLAEFVRENDRPNVTDRLPCPLASQRKAIGRTSSAPATLKVNYCQSAPEALLITLFDACLKRGIGAVSQSEMLFGVYACP